MNTDLAAPEFHLVILKHIIMQILHFPQISEIKTVLQQASFGDEAENESGAAVRTQTVLAEVSGPVHARENKPS